MHPGNYIHFPFIPYWNEKNVMSDEWLWKLEKEYNKKKDQSISLYIHLPFCESLCTHCSFSPYITKDHGVEEKYIESIIKELWMYLEVFKKRPLVNEIYIGGGTPTFFSPKNIDKLLSRIKNGIRLHPEADLTFEGHFSQTSKEHLEIFSSHGFNTIRLGVVGKNKKTQESINREHEAESIDRIAREARFAGIENLHLDLLYGLPFQNRKTIMQAAYSILRLKPERISFYSYEHKPSCYPAHKKLHNEIPFDVEIKAFEEIGNEVFKKEGYIQLSNDMFILQSDQLYKNYRKKQLKKRLFGFSQYSNSICIGLGAGAISECGINYIKNLTFPKSYQKKIKQGSFSFKNAYFPYKKDERTIGLLTDLVSNGEIKFKEDEFQTLINGNKPVLEKMKKKRWLNFSEKGIRLRTKGMENFQQIFKLIDNRETGTAKE